MFKKDNEISLYVAVTAIFVLLTGGAFFFNTTTNIKSIKPVSGSKLSTKTPTLSVDFSSPINEKKIKVFLDGKEISQRLRFVKMRAYCLSPPLKNGKHTLTVRLINGSMRNRTKSSTFRVDTEPPILTVIEPNSFTDVQGDSFTIKGKVETGSKMAIDGKKLDLSDDGSFSMVVRTRRGPYHLQATDKVGNVTDRDVFARKRTAVKGIHIGVSTPGIDWLFNRILKLVDKTELNALQIDIKDEGGIVGYDTGVELAKKIGAVRKCFDLKELIAKCRRKNIYTIGRIVVFEDPKLAKRKRSLAVQTLDGRLWKGRNGTYWVDPYSKDVWKYNVDLAMEAVSHGIDEVQFDYTRFPTDGNLEDISFPHKTKANKNEVISSFLGFARSRLSKSNCYISVDIFGLTALWDLGIGQNIGDMAKNVDYICPMLYPSHYQKGNYGIANPNKNPYLTVRKSLQDFKKKTAGSRARVRPWLQSFSIGHDYSFREIRDEINATEYSGIKEWTLWNASCLYLPKSLKEER